MCKKDEQKLNNEKGKIMLKEDIFENEILKLKELFFDNSQFITLNEVYVVRARKKYEYQKINGENVKTDVLVGSDLVRIILEKGML